MYHTVRLVFEAGSPDKPDISHSHSADCLEELSCSLWTHGSHHPLTWKAVA